MRKAVLISIQGTQCYEGDEPQALELMTNGFYEKQPDRCRILYEETEMTGMDGVKTVFEIFPDHVELNRAGAVESQMVFRPGERMESLYDLGFGALLIAVTATRVCAYFDENGGSLDLAYDIEVEHAARGINTYHIEVTPLADA